MGNNFTTTAASGATSVSAVSTPSTDTDLASIAAAPLKIKTDEAFIQERSVQERIAADEHIAASNVKSPGFGIQVSKFKPGSAVK